MARTRIRRSRHAQTDENFFHDLDALDLDLTAGELAAIRRPRHRRRGGPAPDTITLECRHGGPRRLIPDSERTITLMNADVTGKVGLVTGAGSGIGLVTAQRFSEAGSSVVLSARRTG